MRHTTNPSPRRSRATETPWPFSLRLPASVSFYLLASIMVAFLAGSSAPTPLYATYQTEWHSSPIAITIVFGAYALAVLVALLTLGSLSDHVGRRPVLLAAITIQIAAMVLFAASTGITTLLVARVGQGFATGAAAGAIGAGLLDLNRSRGLVANAVAPPTGSAVGAVFAGLLVQYLPAPTQLVYLLLLGVFLAQGAGVLLMAETASLRPGALASLRQHIAVPPDARRPVLVATPALVAIWALAGFYGSLGPTLIRVLVGSTSPALGGMAVFVLAGSGAVTVMLARNASPRSLMLGGTGAVIVGVALTLVAIAFDSATLLFLGTAVAGSGFGGTFQGAIRSVLPLATSGERAGLLSVLYIVSYLALGVPGVAAGIILVHGASITVTAQGYGAAVILLAALALAGVARLQWAPAGEKHTDGRRPAPPACRHSSDASLRAR